MHTLHVYQVILAAVAAFLFTEGCTTTKGPSPLVTQVETYEDPVEIRELLSYIAEHNPENIDQWDPETAAEWKLLYARYLQLIK